MLQVSAGEDLVNLDLHYVNLVHLRNKSKSAWEDLPNFICIPMQDTVVSPNRWRENPNILLLPKGN